MAIVKKTAQELDGYHGINNKHHLRLQSYVKNFTKNNDGKAYLIAGETLQDLNLTIMLHYTRSTAKFGKDTVRLISSNNIDSKGNRLDSTQVSEIDLPMDSIIRLRSIRLPKKRHSYDLKTVTNVKKMADKGYSMRHIAKELNVSLGTVSKMIKGKYEVDNQGISKEQSKDSIEDIALFDSLE